MKRLALSTGLGLAWLLALAPGAWANDITVNSNGDGAVADANCNLFEAITAANDDTAANGCTAGNGADRILFAASPFNGMVGPSTITTAGEPDITEDLTITGGTCGVLLKPCVGLKVNPAGSNEGLKVTGGAALTATGLAITSASIGIDAQSGTLTTTNSWFGLTLNQSVAAGNVIGVQAESNAAIGDDIAARPNVFAANTTAGVYIFGGDDNSIQRNYFGTQNDGTLVAGFENATNIRIVDDGGSANPATGNSVGGPEADSPQFCDGPCNLISNATGRGLDLVGTGGAEGPATGPTTVAGNFVGLSFNGVNDQGNGSTGIEVGDADNVTVGGPAAADRNYIAGNGGSGIEHGAAGSSFVLNGNFLGLDASGTAAIPDVTRELLSQGSGAIVSGNRFGGSPAVIGGSSSTVQANVFGIGTGGQDVGTNGDFLVIEGSNTQVGGPAMGEGNTIGNTDGATNSAITVEADGVNLYGNVVGTDAGGQSHPNAGHGITVGASSARNNATIGGTLAGQEGNVISNSGGDAIRVPNPGSTNDVFRANTGQSNGSGANDLFVDLGADGPVNATTNAAIQPPAVTSASTTQIQGTSSEANGTQIDVYKTFTDRGDVRSYLGQTTVTGAMTWSFTYPTALANGTCVTAAQTEIGTPKGTSQLAATTTIGGGACDTTPPTATIVSGPSGLTNDEQPTFGLSASEAGSSFECSLDNGMFAACASPFTTPPLSDGEHALQVRATDPVGNTGAPVSRSFEVDATAPQTTVTRFIKRPRRRRAKVIFSSSEPDSSFECKLDGRAFTPCTSPRTYRRLKRGRHTIRVRAIDAAGNVDPTPTKNRLQIRRKRRLP